MKDRTGARGPRPALGYARVSTDEQAREGVSLDAQQARIKAYAQAKDLPLGDILVDEGRSGKDLNRPALQDLLARCDRGEVAHVIVWKLDRLTRRTRHLLSLVEDLFLARKIELHSVSESLDTSTPHGRFVLTLFGGLAQMERELIGERGQLIAELEGAAKDLSALLETARESDGDRLRCKACGSFIPGVSKLRLSDILAVIRELRAVLPAQLEHEGLPPIQVTVVGGGPVVPYSSEQGR